MAKWFDKMPRAVLDKAIERGLVAVGIKISGDAITRAPVDTGRLKGSLSYATRGERSGNQDGVSQPSSPYQVWIGSNVGYAPYVEYGTAKSKAQPYLRPALDRNRKNASKLLMREIMREYGR